MNVLFVAECTKSALKETRRILDQFAERRGERTWQTAITMEGLKTVRRLLRKTARKNTAVACHWIRGIDHSELLWTVGNSLHFNTEGAVPTNSTKQDILRLADENDWHSGELIYLLSSFAALLHDLGKSCDAFQLRLANQAHHDGPNLYRHEWISLRLFQAFVGTSTDAEWLQRIIEGNYHTADWLQALQRDGLEATDKPFAQLPPLAAAVAWLVVTHHRLPQHPEKDPSLIANQFTNYFKEINAEWNQHSAPTATQLITAYWSFSQGLPVINNLWQKRATRLAKRLLHYQQTQTEMNWLNNLYVMHIARLSLMLADHHYSSLSTVQGPNQSTSSPHPQRISVPAATVLQANTNRKTGEFNQSLEEHLVGVAINAGYICHSLPDLERSLPTLKNHRGLRKRSETARFRWQDKAADLATVMREPSQQQGAFIINMASTGCGKTLANARIMYALAEPSKGARFSVALGLRSLTLQTGEAYRQHKMYLDEDQLAIRVGGSASKALFEFYQQQAEQHGSASIQDLIDEDGGVLFEGDYHAHPLLARTLHQDNIKALVAAPVLVCTVDHLTPATESLRGGRQIAPMLRLMTSDLVLDEIDDYGLEDLPAMARLVHWAGLLGARVMLSSATLPPALVQGLYDAYRAGREHYQANRGQVKTPLNICCAWVDEQHAVRADCATSEQFKQHHTDFVQRRAKVLNQAIKQQQIRRSSELIAIEQANPTGLELYSHFAQQILASALQLHTTNHSIDPRTGKKVSFGLIRMANIQPLIQVALALFNATLPEDTRIHLCVYHSQFPLLMRSAIEAELDNSLKRQQPDAVFERPRIKQALHNTAETNQLFIVLGSPVTEVGRDHDYDWAVVEPSSMRSLIQLAGRIRRHRPEPYLKTNIHLLQRNIKSFIAPHRPVFTKPGFETEQVKLISHDLAQLLEPKQWQIIDAQPRIVECEELNPTQNLVDLEHYQLQQTLLPQFKTTGSPRRGAATTTLILGAHSWWSAEHASLMGLLQKAQPFRAGATQIDFALLPNAAEDDFVLHEITQAPGLNQQLYIAVEQAKLIRLPDASLSAERVQPWIQEDYLELLTAQATAEEISLMHCAKKYGVLSINSQVHLWCFHPVLGFFINS